MAAPMAPAAHVAPDVPTPAALEQQRKAAQATRTQEEKKKRQAVKVIQTAVLEKKTQPFVQVVNEAVTKKAEKQKKEAQAAVAAAAEKAAAQQKLQRETKAREAREAKRKEFYDKERVLLDQKQKILTFIFDLTSKYYRNVDSWKIRDAERFKEWLIPRQGKLDEIYTRLKSGTNDTMEIKKQLKKQGKNDEELLHQETLKRLQEINNTALLSLFGIKIKKIGNPNYIGRPFPELLDYCKTNPCPSDIKEPPPPPPPIRAPETIAELIQYIKEKEEENKGTLPPIEYNYVLGCLVDILLKNPQHANYKTRLEGIQKIVAEGFQFRTLEPPTELKKFNDNALKALREILDENGECPFPELTDYCAQHPLNLSCPAIQKPIKPYVFPAAPITGASLNPSTPIVGAYRTPTPTPTPRRPITGAYRITPQAIGRNEFPGTTVFNLPTPIRQVSTASVKVDQPVSTPTPSLSLLTPLKSNRIILPPIHRPGNVDSDLVTAAAAAAKKAELTTRVPLGTAVAQQQKTVVTATLAAAPQQAKKEDTQQTKRNKAAAQAQAIAAQNAITRLKEFMAKIIAQKGTFVSPYAKSILDSVLKLLQQRVDVLQQPIGNSQLHIIESNLNIDELLTQAEQEIKKAVQTQQQTKRTNAAAEAQKKLSSTATTTHIQTLPPPPPPPSSSALGTVFPPLPPPPSSSALGTVFPPPPPPPSSSALGTVFPPPPPTVLHSSTQKPDNPASDKRTDVAGKQQKEQKKDPIVAKPLQPPPPPQQPAETPHVGSLPLPDKDLKVTDADLVKAVQLLSHQQHRTQEIPIGNNDMVFSVVAAILLLVL